MKSIHRLGVWGLILATALSGCGYTSKTTLPRDIKTVYVETVKNKLDPEKIYAYQQGIEMDITNSVIRHFHQDGTVRVTEKEKADAILKLDLLQYEQEGLRFNSLEAVQEYRLFIVMKLRFLDAKTGDLIWEEPNFTGDTEYYVTQVTSIGEQKASQQAVENLSKNIVNRVVEDW